MENKQENPFGDYKSSLKRYKLQRWHSWIWLVYFNMYNLIQFTFLLRDKDEASIVFMGICLPLFSILCFAHSNIILTLYSARLKPLLITKFPKEFADDIWKQVYDNFFHPTVIIFSWISMISAIVYPIYFAIQFAKWWTWLIYIVVTLIYLLFVLFTTFNLSELGSVGKKVYKLYEGDK